jgi:hypothetical protein
MIVPAGWKTTRVLLWALVSWGVMAMVALLAGVARDQDVWVAMPVLTVVLLAEGAALGILFSRLLKLRRVLGSERRLLEEFRQRSPEATATVERLEALNDEASHLATV